MAIAQLEQKSVTVVTPTGANWTDIAVDEENVCVVSIMRAGDSFLQEVLACCPGMPVGKLLIQRDEASADKHPVLFYRKLPPVIAETQVLLVDPMLATGGSANLAIQTMLDAGVKEERIVFASAISCREGIAAVRAAHPGVTLVTGVVDEGLNAEKYIVPGLGDFGDRFFGTV